MRIDYAENVADDELGVRITEEIEATPIQP